MFSANVIYGLCYPKFKASYTAKSKADLRKRIFLQPFKRFSIEIRVILNVIARFLKKRDFRLIE